MFKGFLCQVRKFNSSDTAAIGSFTSFDTGKAQNVACTTSKVRFRIFSTLLLIIVSTFQGAVGHRNRDDVSGFSATWEAPSSVSGDTQLAA